MSFIFGPVVYSYTHAQPLEDGNLEDVSTVAKEAGWKYPVALTAALWSAVETIPKAHNYHDVQGRLWDVLYMASLMARKSQGSRFVFELILFREESRKKFVQLVADCGPGDQGEPVVTIGFPEDF